MPTLLKIFLKHRRALALVLGLVFFLSLIPLHPAQALITKFTECGDMPVWDKVACYTKGVADSLALIPVFLLLGPIIGPIIIVSFLGIFASFIFYAIAAILLNWVAGPSFVSLSLTQATNPIINAGWTFTSGLVNLAFILVLVFIAIATIFRLQSYGLKKLLPKFIFVVILINFSLVITGAVVDIANIVQNNFLSSIKGIGDTFVSVFLERTPIIGTLFSDLTAVPIEGEECKLGEPFLCALDNAAQEVLSFSGLLGMIIQAAAAIFFGFFAGFVILLYVLLFMLRIIVLWFLAILAPIAFFCWILPATKSVFKMWWTYLLQWAFVGAIAGFFLRLSEVVISQMDELTPAITAPPNNIVEALFSPITTVITNLFAFGAVIAFLLIGFFISIKTAGGGTEAILKWGEKIPGMLSKTRLGQRALGGLASRTQRFLKDTSPYAKRMEETAGRIPLLGKGLKPLATAVSRPLGWASRGINRLAGPTLIRYAAEREKIALPPNFEKWSGPRQEEWVTAKGLSSRDRLSAAAKMGGNMEYTSKEFQNAVQADAKSVFDSNTLSYADEAKSISKIYAGDVVDEKTLEGMKTIGKVGIDRQRAIDELKKDVEETKKHIESSMSENDLTIEAGLKLKYVTKEDVERNEASALAQAKSRLTTGQMEKFKRDIASAATYIKEFKGSDIGKMAGTKNLATRMGLILGNPNNLQKVVDEHGRAALEDVFKGRGGLNKMADTPEKLEALHRKIPGMVRSLITNPALQHMEWKGRSNMLNARDQKTQNFNDFEKRMEMKEILAKDGELKRYNSLLDEINGLKRDIEDLERARGPEEKIKESRTKLGTANRAKDTVWRTRIASDQERKKNWDRVQWLKNPPKKSKNTGGKK